MSKKKNEAQPPVALRGAGLKAIKKNERNLFRKKNPFQILLSRLFFALEPAI